MKRYDTNSQEAALIYETLQREYPLEIKKIQMLAAQDMAMHGSVTKKTDDMMNELMAKVVEDNKRLGRT